MTPTRQTKCEGSRTVHLLHDLAEPQLQRGRNGIRCQLVPFEIVDGQLAPSDRWSSAGRSSLLRRRVDIQHRAAIEVAANLTLFGVRTFVYNIHARSSTNERCRMLVNQQRWDADGT